MPTKDNDDHLIEQLVHNLISKTDTHYDTLNGKVDSVNDRVDIKVDNLAERLTGEFHLLRKDVSDKIGDMSGKLDTLENKQVSHEVRITKIEHNWTTLTVLVTAVAGLVATVVGWVVHMMGIK